MKFLILLSALCVVYAQNSESESRIKPIYETAVQESSSSITEDKKQSKRQIFDGSTGIGFGPAAPVPLDGAFGGAFAADPTIGAPGTFGAGVPPPTFFSGAGLAAPVPLSSGFAPLLPQVGPAQAPICGANPCPVPVPISQTVEITKPVPVPVYRTVGVAVPQPVPYPVPHPVAVRVPQPYPVEVPVIKNIPYPVEKPIPVPYPVEKPYPVHVWKKVPVFIPKPYPVHIYKHIHHIKEHKKDWGCW